MMLPGRRELVRRRAESGPLGEAGLRRRPLVASPTRAKPAVPPPIAPMTASPERIEPADDALRSALAELQRIAGQRV